MVFNIFGFVNVVIKGNISFICVILNNEISNDIFEIRRMELSLFLFSKFIKLWMWLVNDNVKIVFYLMCGCLD